MNFDDAEKAHIQWITRLRMYANGNLPEKLESGTVKLDNVCALGKWIYGEAQTLVPVGELSPLIQAHADFHLSAAEIVFKVDGKMLEDAKSLLDDPQSMINRKVHEVVTALRLLSSRYG